MSAAATGKARGRLTGDRTAQRPPRPSYTHPTTIEAEEAEEIGVEHLLRDIRDVAVGTLSTRITSQLQSLQGLHLRLQDIGRYLQKVLDGDLPVNHAILGNLQDVFNLLPNLSTPKAHHLKADLPSVNGMVNGSASVLAVGQQRTRSWRAR